MNIVQRLCLFVAIAGGIALVGMLGLALTLFFVHGNNYDENVLPWLLPPFDIVFIVTLVLGLYLYLSQEK